MKRRGVYGWARQQLDDDPKRQLWPLWLRLAIVGGILLLILLKLAGVI